MSAHYPNAKIVKQAHDDNTRSHESNLGMLRAKLRRAMEDAFQMVELGGVLAKSAKIEAAYGQAFAGSLAQVSGEFDGIVEEIRVSLESLRRSSFFTIR